MTLKDNDYSFIEFFTKDKKFVDWVNEVHADFGASEKCFQNIKITEFKHWFFGHYHDNRNIYGNFYLLYDQIAEVIGKEEINQK